jgi:hypothetical protein
MSRISSRCLVAFRPSSEMRVLKRLGAICGCDFEIEFQFHINLSLPACQRENEKGGVQSLCQGDIEVWTKQRKWIVGQILRSRSKVQGLCAVNSLKCLYQ